MAEYLDLTDIITNCTVPASDSFPQDLFTLSQKRDGAVVFHVLGALYAFGCLSIVCNYYFISSIECICCKLGLSGDVAGATFMSIGTSAPELITACIGVFITKTNVGIETVAGSTVFNMFFITGLVIFAANTTVVPEYWPVMRDLGAFVLVTCALTYTIYDGIVRWYEAAIVLGVYILYIILMMCNDRLVQFVNERFFHKGEKKPLFIENHTPSIYQSIDPISEKPNQDVEQGKSMDKLPLARSNSTISIHSAYMEEIGGTYQPQLVWPEKIFDRITYVLFFPIKIIFWLTIPDCNKEGCWEQLYMMTFLISGSWIGLSCYFLVWMIEIIGLTLAIPEPVLAVTALAVGTSIPDCLASFAAARKGHQTMAISNVLGSNIFDLACTAIPWLLQIAVGGTDMPGALRIETSSVLFTVISLLTGAALVMIVFTLFRWQLRKVTAAFLMFLYGIYLSITTMYEFNVFGPVNLPYCE